MSTVGGASRGGCSAAAYRLSCHLWGGGGRTLAVIGVVRALVAADGRLVHAQLLVCVALAHGAPKPGVVRPQLHSSCARHTECKPTQQKGTLLGHSCAGDMTLSSVGHHPSHSYNLHVALPTDATSSVTSYLDEVAQRLTRDLMHRVNASCRLGSHLCGTLVVVQGIDGHV